MKSRQFKKAAGAAGLIAIISLAGFSLSVAHDNSPAAAGEFFGPNHSPQKASSPDGYALRFGLLPKSGSSLISFQWAFQQINPVRAPSSVSIRQWDFTAAKVQKIALHVLDSILLI
jgi:hypothetical protein